MPKSMEDNDNNLGLVNKAPDGGKISFPIPSEVNHPKHYTSHPSGVECIEITRHMTFNLGNVVKYLWRAGLKVVSDSQIGADSVAEARLRDLKKARWYLDDEIKELEKNQ